MSSRYRITDQTPVYFITTSTHCWVPLLFNDTIFQIILDSLKYCQAHKGLNLHGYVLMPNHLHAIFSHPLPDQLPGIVRDFKRHTSTKISTYLGSLGQFSQLFWLKGFHSQERGQTRLWQAGYHPIAIWSQAVFEQKLTYIHHNPVKKGFVEQPEHWKYSSARNYLWGDERLIVIDRLGQRGRSRFKSAEDGFRFQNRNQQKSMAPVTSSRANTPTTRPGRTCWSSGDCA